MLPGLVRRRRVSPDDGTRSIAARAARHRTGRKLPRDRVGVHRLLLDWRRAGHAGALAQHFEENTFPIRLRSTAFRLLKDTGAVQPVWSRAAAQPRIPAKLHELRRRCIATTLALGSAGLGLGPGRGAG